MPKKDPRDKWTINHFSQANPRGPGQGGVGALLRRVADTLDRLGDIQVEDLTFSKEMTDGEDWVSLTVYYHRDVRRGDEHV